MKIVSRHWRIPHEDEIVIDGDDEGVGADESNVKSTDILKLPVVRERNERDLVFLSVLSLHVSIRNHICLYRAITVTTTLV